MNTRSLPRREFTSSELSRNPRQVFDAAEQGAVTVTRRDAATLVVMREQEAKAQKQLFEFAAQLIAITTDDRGTLAERMVEHFPWMLALNKADQTRCANELVSAARTAFATEQPMIVVTELHAWRETAETLAAGYHSTITTWLDNAETIARP